MKIAYIIFDGITWLDLIGIYDPISRLKLMNFLPDLTWDICSNTETVKDNFGLTVKPDKIRNTLDIYDVLIIPGGIGTRKLRRDEEFMKWISTAAPVKLKISVCTGSLILGAAGFLKNVKATTNYLEYETLRAYCREVIEDKIVDEGNIITAGAVTNSIDLGLYLCEKWAGREAQREIRQRMGYHEL